MKRPIDDKDQIELHYELMAFLTEINEQVVVTNTQLSYMYNILLLSGIKRSVAVHLFLNPELNKLFKSIRLAVSCQLEKNFVDIEKIVYEWANETLTAEGLDDLIISIRKSKERVVN